LATAQLKQIQLTDFYVDAHTHEPPVVEQRIVQSGHLLDSLHEYDGRDRAELTFLDFGAGAGEAACAATHRYKRSIACEWDLRALDRTIEAAPQYKKKVVRTKDIKQVAEQVDVVFMWHVLEHLPHPTRFWRQCANRLRHDAVFFVQIPLYRPAHVVNCHYTFFTERSISAWASCIGCDGITTMYDTGSGFLSFVAKFKELSEITAEE
jgi:2-polyprenyl-3-methyl-5-hydroxy-6-metoxy-1,4-benzoquinol methylase